MLLKAPVVVKTLVDHADRDNCVDKPVVPGDLELLAYRRNYRDNCVDKPVVQDHLELLAYRRNYRDQRDLQGF